MYLYFRVICLCSNPAAATFVCASTTGRARTGSLGGEVGHSTGNRVGKLTLWDLKTMKTEVCMASTYQTLVCVAELYGLISFWSTQRNMFEEVVKLIKGPIFCLSHFHY